MLNDIIDVHNPGNSRAKFLDAVANQIYIVLEIINGIGLAQPLQNLNTKGSLVFI